MGAQMLDAAPVAQLDIMHMAQPVVRQANSGAPQRRQHTATTIVANHHDVLNLEVVYRKLDH